MSNVRRDHPGYFGVLMAIAGFYLYNGLGFLLYPARFTSSPAYDVLRAILPLKAWGVVLFALGLWLVFAIQFLPHRWVRRAVAVNLMLDVLWTLGFLYGQFVLGDVQGFTIVSSWGAFAFVEYRALIEPAVNPASAQRRAADAGLDREGPRTS
ncbi:MAG TPA: hypothetical protein VIN56_10125 [Candidatus Dormibacteraeota bacterium]|jgi:hypothetical protein